MKTDEREVSSTKENESQRVHKKLNHEKRFLESHQRS